MDNNLSNFIKYCLGYVKITRARTTLAQQKYSVKLPTEYFGLLGLLNGDTDGNLAELIDLDLFYNLDPNEITEEREEEYKKQKKLANKIDEIYNKQKNNQYTKEIVLNFGYFEIEIPIISDDDIVDIDEETQQSSLFNESENVQSKQKIKVERYPLFSLPVRIQKEICKSGAGKYNIYFVDPEVQINISMLEPILGNDLYFSLLEEMGKYEIDDRLSLPILDLEVFTEIWHKIKAQLRLKESKFGEESFSLEEMKVALSPKSNYFLAEDLAKLSQLGEEDLAKTALTSWTQIEDLNNESEVPHEKDLYFPFLYDKYQLSTLSLLNNKASIIQGPPGTGKSETISNILCHLAAQGKRVLFVSQKAQALKVVKDKLKKLNVKYLYGYLPNPNSDQVGEEDEADGVAPQLSALSSYITQLSDLDSSNSYHTIKQPSGKLDKITAEKDKRQQAINTTIDHQREVYKLNQELNKLAEYDIDITDFKCFSASFNSAEWNEIKRAKEEINRLRKYIDIYKESDDKKAFDKTLAELNLHKHNYSKQIINIKDDIVCTGYDRHSEVGRKINNTLRNIRLNKIRKNLPCEIIDHIDQSLKTGTRNDQEKSIKSIYNHCLYYENIRSLKAAEKKLKKRLSTCGVSNDEFKIIDTKIQEAETKKLEEIKSKIIRVQEIKIKLKKLSNSESVNRLSASVKKYDELRRGRIATYIQNIINNSITQKWQKGVTVKQIVRKLARAFGKSKKAFKTFDNIRKDVNNFNAILDLIPIWIMELDDASRIIPLEPGIFDYVILDEASQCNVAYTLPVMYRTNRVLFVGDSEQMRDSTIMFKSNRIFDDLAHRYQIPEERQIKSTGSAVQSVLDIAYQRGFNDKQLRYHYRSPAELIGFSNKYFYKPNGKELIPINSNYLTYKDSNRVMLIHDVQSDWSEEISDSVNVAEAKAILDLFKELRNNERYTDKSIGILSFFNAQASFIRQLFEQEGFKEEDDNYKVSIIEGIQGDEKDIVIYSFVIRDPDQKRRYVPLTGEGGGY